METITKIIKRSDFFVNEEIDLTPLERKWIRKAMTNLILGYRLSGNEEMFRHMMEPHSK